MDKSDETSVAFKQEAIAKAEKAFKLFDKARLPPH
jgi:Ca2+-binding EF-hand superfamily protein